MATPPPPAVVAEMRIALALAASASAARWPFTSDPLDFWAGGGKLFVSSGAAMQGVVQSAEAHERVPNLWLRGVRGL